jgi:hypothetical protein
MWRGETVFVVGGGPSVAGQNIEVLRDRKLIAINSSYAVASFADMLFFGDGRWWNANRREVLDAFKGEIATVASETSADKEVASRLQILKKTEQWSDDPGAVFVRRTSVTGAINLGYHRGARRFVLLGIDGGPLSGRTHHHEPHAWSMPGNWVAEQRKDFEVMNVALKSRGVEVLNASPCSVYDFWPIVKLEDHL